jgi:predicted phosphodiesterase
MKYALISDIHANLPALTAVLRDIDARDDVHTIYHLGDLVGYAPWPNDTVELIQSRGIVGIAGNYDSTVATDYKHCGCKYEDPHQEELSHLSYDWTRKNTNAASKRFLGSLPFRLDVRPLGGHGSGPTLVLVHGTPTLNTLYWYEDRPESFFTRMAELAGAKEGDVIAFGHTHLPYHRQVGAVHFVNTGSVGRPKDGDSRAGYVLVNFETANVDVEFVRVTYAVDEAAKAIRASDLPAEFAQFLETGGKIT